MNVGGGGRNLKLCFMMSDQPISSVQNQEVMYTVDGYHYILNIFYLLEISLDQQYSISGPQHGSSLTTLISQAFLHISYCYTNN